MESFDCDRYDQMRADVNALGAPSGPERGLLLSRDGAPYSVSVSLGVA